MGEYEKGVNQFLRTDSIAKTSNPYGSKDIIGKLFPKHNVRNSLCTPEKINKKYNISQSALYEEKENERLCENIFSGLGGDENLMESEDESNEAAYFFSGNNIKRENINPISPSFLQGITDCPVNQINNNFTKSTLKTNTINLIQENENKKKNVATINNKENKVNIKLVNKNESNNLNNLFENETIIDSELYQYQENYINSQNQNNLEQLNHGISMELEEIPKEANKSIISTDALKEDKIKKKVGKADKPVFFKSNQRNKYENVNINPNKISQESDKDININANIQLYANKGKKITPKFNSGNLGIIPDDDDEIISKQENSKEKENSNNSKKIKPNTKKNRFIITNEKQNIYIKNSIISIARKNENIIYPVPNLINMNLNKENLNINQEKIENCGEIKNVGINIFEKEEQKEENGIIYTQQFIEISKKNEAKNDLPKLKRYVFGNYYQNINSLIKEESLKLKKNF